MADRYWVGGAGTWNTTNTANWSATSGGAGGASVPTAADSVFFDQAGTYTVTLGGSAGSLACDNFTVSAGVVTFAGNGAAQLLMSGSLSTTASTTWSGNAGNITCVATTTGKTITTNGATWNYGFVFTGVGGGWSLGSAFSSPGGTQGITVTAGTFSTNNYALTVAALTINGGTFNAGSSLITLAGSSAFTYTNGTFNASTSDIRISGTTGVLNGGGQTFYLVSFTSASSSASVTITGANIFTNLTISPKSGVGVKQVSFAANQTINGTLTLSAGTNTTMRTFVRSNTIGTTRTLTCAAVASLTDIDFRDITIAGAAAPVSGTRLGDCKGNSGITFDAPKTVYYRAAGPTNWGDSIARWSLTNGGTADFAAFPLAQDTAVFPSSPTPYPSSGSSVTVNTAFNIGTIDMSARTSNTMTLATGTQTPAIYGNWINGTGTTLTGTGNLTFAGRGNQTITSAGKTFTQNSFLNNPGGNLSLVDAFSCNRSVSSVANLELVAGSFDDGGYSVTLAATASNTGFRASGSLVRSLTANGAWSVAGTSTSFDCSASTNLTVTGTGTISLTSASAKTFAGGGIQTYPTINQGGTGTLTITGSNKFANITNTAIGRVQFTGGTTNEFTSFTLSGSVGTPLQLGSTNTTQAILKKPTSWQMGLLSTDAGNNTGLTFLSNDGTMEYLSVSYINGQISTPPVTSYLGNFFAFF